jgi:hypothetical protein
VGSVHVGTDRTVGVETSIRERHPARDLLLRAESTDIPEVTLPLPQNADNDRLHRISTHAFLKG